MSQTQALLHLLFLTIMILLLVGGSVSILLLWWMRGRDPQVGPVAEYLTEPPDNLSPGAAGTLIDEHADHHDVLATLLGLGRHGAVRIAQVADPSGRIAKAHDYQIDVLDPDRITSNLERTLLNALFNGPPAAGDSVLLGSVRDRFQQAEPSVRDALYQELVDREFFTRSPADTRRRWQWLARAGMIVSLVAGGFLGFSLDPFAFLAMGAGVIVSFVLLRVSRSMPKKTFAGAEAAAMWRAFRTYLKDIEKYEKLDEARALFDKYLAYAVAFELEKQWVTSFAKAGASNPGWFQTAGSPQAGGGMDIGDTVFTTIQMGTLFGGVPGNGSTGDVNLPDVNLPDLSSMPDFDLQGLSEGLGSGLQGASDAFSGLLDIAGSIFDSIDFDIDA